MEKFFEEVVALQEEYQKLVKNKQLTKKAMCDLCVPFRDNYHLTDLQALRIARNEMPLLELIHIGGTIDAE